MDTLHTRPIGLIICLAEHVYLSLSIIELPLVSVWWPQSTFLLAAAAEMAVHANMHLLRPSVRSRHKALKTWNTCSHGS